MPRGSKAARPQNAAAASGMPPPPRWWVFAFVVPLALVVMETAFHTTHTSVLDPRLPGVQVPDRQLVTRLRACWPTASSLIVDTAPQHDRRPLESAARPYGEAGARAILSLLVEKYGKQTDGDVAEEFDPFESPQFGGMALSDLDRFRPASLLGELADHDTWRALIHALPDQSFRLPFRRALAIALCQSRHAAALAPLLDRVLDRHEDNALKRSILLRLHRLRVPPPARLRELMALPFGGLDLIAAATLARMGDPAGARLVLDGLDLFCSDLVLGSHFAEAAQRVAGRTMPFDLASVPVELRGEDVDRHKREQLEPHRRALQSYLAKLSNAPPVRKVPRSLDDILGKGEDFDLAAAALLLTDYHPRTARLTLDRLDRLAVFLRGKLEGVTDPNERIEILNEWLLRRRHEANVSRRDPSRLSSGFRVAPGGADQDEHVRRDSPRVSFLPVVFERDYGNCVGYSTLFLAMGDRLELPLHGVTVPEHCFVRYDDGRTRRNIETTDGGRNRSDEEQLPVSRRGLGKHVFLGNLSKRQMLAVIVANHAWSLASEHDFGGAAEAAECALRLDPDQRDAHVHLAYALFHLGGEKPDRIAAALAAAIELHPRRDLLCDAGLVLMECGRLREARAYLDRAYDRQDTPRARVALALCLARGGDVAESLALLAPIRSRARLVALEARIRRNPDQADALVNREFEQPAARYSAASVLVDLGRPRHALRLLAVRIDRYTSRVSPDHDPSRHAPDLFRSVRRRGQLARARACHALGRKGEARRALAAAEELGPPDFYLNRARRLIRGGG